MASPGAASALTERLRRAAVLGVGPVAGVPLALGGVVLALLIVAAVASLLPARRAARVDPLIAIRAE